MGGLKAIGAANVKQPAYVRLRHHQIIIEEKNVIIVLHHLPWNSDTFQFMPARGYAEMFHRMLDHPNIELRLATDVFAIRTSIEAKEIIYTGRSTLISTIGSAAFPTGVCASNMSICRISIAINRSEQSTTQTEKKLGVPPFELTQ